MSSDTILRGLPADIPVGMSKEDEQALEALALAPFNPSQTTINVQILVGSPTLGTVRIEWSNAMNGMIAPPNWATVRSTPTGFLTPDGQNMLVDNMLRGKFQALLMIEDDTMPPPQTLIEMDRWFWKMEHRLAPPVVSGVYHIKGSAEVRHGKTGGITLLGPEPLIYRESGTRAYRDWKYGDVVWARGIPTGALLLHRSILEAWAREPDVEDYTMPPYPFTMKKIFRNPSQVWRDPYTKATFAAGGTSDLWWSDQTIRRGIFKKAGWPEYAKKRYPYIVDTALHFGHIDRATGVIY